MITTWVISIFNLLGIQDLTTINLLGFNMTIGCFMLSIFCLFTTIIIIELFIFVFNIFNRKKKRKE